MDKVNHVRDTNLGREVVLKILPSEVSANAYPLQRFEREARAATAVRRLGSLSNFDRFGGL